MGVFGDASVFAIVGFFVTIISCVFQIIGFSTPLWNYFEANSIKIYNGLWESCGSVLGTVTCVRYSCGSSTTAAGCTDQWKAAQAMEVMAAIALVAASVLVILKMCVMKDKSAIRFAAIGCCFAAGAFAIIGIIVYATETNIKSANNGGSAFHFSFAITIIAAIGSFAAGGLLIAGK